MIFVLNLVGMITNLLWKQCAIQVCFPSLASASKQDNAKVILAGPLLNYLKLGMGDRS